MENLIASAHTILATTPARWTALVAHVPADLLSRRPAREEWSALECLEHILDTEGVFQTRVEAFLAGRDFPAFDPDSEGTQGGSPDAAALAARFAALRLKGLAAIERLKPGDLVRQARHPELGMVSLEMMVNEWVAHDLNHTIQAERAIMQPFIQGSGAWQFYFESQVVR